jgi:hypothetical protein
MKVLCKAQAAVLLGLTSGAMQAGVIVIDQPSENGTMQIQVSSPFGQSFTAVSSSIESIGVGLVNMNVNSPDWLADHDVTLNLYSGSGFSGTLLASSTVDVAASIGDLLGAEGLITFGLGTVPVTAGGVYSFALTDAEPRFGAMVDYHDPYAEGRAFFGPSFPWGGSDRDLEFNVSAVPEPATYALTFGSLALLVVAARKCLA